VGPDRSAKADNHANSNFAFEGRLIRDFLAAQKNTFVICGDRHWQYHSQDENGVQEFSVGAASDNHAGGWSQNDVRPEHKFLRVEGGFLSGEVEMKDGIPTLTLTHRSVEGRKVNEVNFSEN
jgi:alkaline phosphatase D